MAQSLEDTNTYFRMVVLNYSILLQPLCIVSERIHRVKGSNTFGSSVCFIDEKRFFSWAPPAQTQRGRIKSLKGSTISEHTFLHSKSKY